MTRAEAQLAALVPPDGWSARPDRARDAARTALVVTRGVAEVLIASARGAELAATTTADGLERVQRTCRAHLGALGVSVEVEGAERVPRAGGLVFMWNQTSHLDHLILPVAIPRPFHTTYNNEVRRTPIYGRWLERGGHFWLDRTDEAQWRAQLDRAADRIRAGATLLISPEGTRSWDGAILPMKRGAFLLARAAARPIVCLTIVGARERLPRGRAAVRPGRVRVVVAPPLDGTGPDLERDVAATFAATLAAVRCADA
jgi:1-acyl-sn-glycerol-3-phosphate acyltransferase